MKISTRFFELLRMIGRLWTDLPLLLRLLKAWKDGSYRGLSVRTLAFSVAALIAYVSRFMSLRAGDVISTGTPAGVGHGAKPPKYLVPGDVVEMGITGLGAQRHQIVEAR